MQDRLVTVASRIAGNRSNIHPLRITEAELVRDVRAVLDTVERGNEVLIEREDHRPLA